MRTKPIDGLLEWIWDPTRREWSPLVGFWTNLIPEGDREWAFQSVRIDVIDKIFLQAMYESDLPYDCMKDATLTNREIATISAEVMDYYGYEGTDYVIDVNREDCGSDSVRLSANGCPIVEESSTT